MTPAPRISVVTASKNQGRFIGDAIRSVLAQGLPGAELEHIVVDAISSDETAAVLAGFSGCDHLRVIREPDRGQSDGLNKGFLAARGEIVAWLNADDYFLPGAFAAVLDAVARRPRAAAFFGHYLFVDSGGRFVRSMRIPPFDAGVCRHYGVCAPTSGAFFSRAVFQERRILLDTDLEIVMDWDFYQRIADAGLEIVQVPRFLSAFRLHGANKSIGVAGDASAARRRLDERRKLERRTFEQRYGARLGAGELADRALVRAMFHLHHGRFVVQKGLRLYYLMNALDRVVGRDARPAT